MPAPFRILALDLHNTLYDEALEYGLAIEEAIAYFMNEAARQNHPVTRERLCGELACAHRQLGSDWDDGAWRILPSLKGLKDFERHCAEAVAARKRRSRELTQATRYLGTIETMSELKSRGVRIFVITEAAADAGLEAISGLGLSQLVDGMYSYPSRAAHILSAPLYHKSFPAAKGGGFLKKPHPFLLAAVALDEAIRSGRLPHETTLQDVFSLAYDDSLRLPELPADAQVQSDVATRLTLKDTPCKQALEDILSSMLYVGDSKFKDGFLARNAGVKFALAAYGKKVVDKKRLEKSLATMYAVTGWETETLRLTQEAGRSDQVSALAPDFVFEASIRESLVLFS